MAVIGVIAQGMMGAGVGRRLHESGATVRTLLTGRSRASAERAEKAGMAAAASERELLSGADFFLSILPPGEAEALIAELTESQPEMLARFREGIPRMYDKAYRWVAEMEEISDFLEKSPPSRDIYAAIARLYADLAVAEAEKEPGPDNAVRTLDRVLGR